MDEFLREVGHWVPVIQAGTAVVIMFLTGGLLAVSRSLRDVTRRQVALQEQLDRDRLVQLLLDTTMRTERGISMSQILSPEDRGLLEDWRSAYHRDAAALTDTNLQACLQGVHGLIFDVLVNSDVIAAEHPERLQWAHARARLAVAHARRHLVMYRAGRRIGPCPLLGLDSIDVLTTPNPIDLGKDHPAD